MERGMLNPEAPPAAPPWEGTTPQRVDGDGEGASPQVERGGAAGPRETDRSAGVTVHARVTTSLSAGGRDRVTNAAAEK